MKRGRSPERDRPRGICSACGSILALKNDGTVRMHGEFGKPCAGVAKLPIATYDAILERAQARARVR